MFAAIDNLLYYTIAGSPDYWPSTNFIQIAGDITGLFAIPAGVAIFINSKVYLLVGTNATTFRLTLLNPEQGCLNHNTIKVGKNTLMWVSADGICTLSGSTVRVITKEKLDRETFSTISAVVYNEQYMLTLTDGTVFIADLRFGNRTVFKTLNYIQTDIYNLGVFDNILYAVINEQIAFIDNGRLIDFYYTSPRLTEGNASITKLYNNVYINADGRFIFDVYIDNVKVITKEFEGSEVFELKIPQEKQRGSDIQFKVVGSGIVREIEYKVVGRENGR